MRAEEVLKLVNAGFTKEEIIKMDAETQPSQPLQETTPMQKEEPEQTVQTQPEVQPTDNKQAEQVGIPAALNETLAKLNAAITQMQQQAVMNSQQPAKLSTDDILASIINPPNYQSK